MTGAELRRARLKLGKTQAQVARELKLTPDAICKYEAGTRDNTLKKIERLLNGYGFAIVSTEPKTEPEAWNDYTEQK